MKRHSPNNAPNIGYQYYYLSDILGNQPLQVIQRSTELKLELFTSAEILAELKRVLSYSKFVELFEKRKTNLEQVLINFEALCTVISTKDIVIPDVVRDPKDRIILACAVAAKADYIITGDADLLVLNPYDTIQILRPAEFLAILDEAD